MFVGKEGGNCQVKHFLQLFKRSKFWDFADYQIFSLSQVF